MKPAPIRRPGFVITALALLLVLSWLTHEDDDIGAEQLADAQHHAQRDAEERRIAAALKEGRKQ